MRKAYELTAAEKRSLDRAPPIEGRAFAIWHQIAEERGLDVHSLLSTGPLTFTGLPLGHGKHWCFPSSLKCRA